MLLRRKISKSKLEKLDFLLSSQFWPLEKLKDYQKQKLEKLLQHCYRHVPYYRNLFKKTNLAPERLLLNDGFEKIPILTKHTISEHFDELLADNADKSKLFLNSTGGSTGQALNFYQDQKYSDWRGAAAFRAWKYFPGFENKTIEAIVWGAEQDIGKGFGLKDIIYHLFREGIYPLNTFDLDHKTIKKYFFYFNLLKPKLLRGYASSLYHLAKHVEKENLRVKSPAAIVSSAEMLWPEMRKKIESVFNARVFDSYGCREVSQIGTECREHDGFHIVMENQYVELIDGQIIVTNLNNYCMPLIRYKIGDMAESITESRCPCGRESQRIKKLLGRESEMITLEDGRTIHGEYFTHLFYGRFGVDDFTVEYDSKTAQLTFKCNNINEMDKNDICKTLKKDFSIIRPRFEELTTVDKTVSGKYKFINIV